MLLEIHLLVKWMEIFIVDLKGIMNMAEYDIVGNVAESASILKKM